MANQTSRQRIESALARIERKHSQKFDYNKQGSGYRLTDAAGSREISPRLPAQSFALWLEAFKEGLDIGTAPVTTPNSFTGGYSRHCGACGMLLQTYCPPPAEAATQVTK